ncbi:MAG: DMT family transporter [Bacteroidales bacterium]|jgi:drug/metabolite transporter (DMT)-like permease|nr:DMT family transporter [Bacteroidales bacterium]MDI9592119.1 DMT family transporter [Bacteroidota bacterium]HOF80103.1 DMT family transporter [Bacteroidales bacterium]HOR75422.1 DMT family transporter [Bacteroidales bacterium]HPL10834.1 DMT family transporter [Bacteroidales bacterium]
MKNQSKAYLYAIAATFLWSTIGTAFKLSLRYIAFADLLLFSTLVSTFILFLVMVITGKVKLLKDLMFVDWLRGAFLGVLNPFLYYLVLLKAYDLLLAQEAGTLNYIWPVVLVLLSIPLLKQKISWLSVGAILISFFGTLVIGTRGNILTLEFKNPLGVFLAVSSAIFWALFWIFNVKDKNDEVIKLFINFCFGSLFILIYVIASSGFHLPNYQGIVGSVYVGIVEMSITYIIWLKALQLSGITAKVSNLIYLSPFISLIIIHFIVGEQIFLSTFLGLILIVTGILIQQVLPKIKT